VLCAARVCDYGNAERSERLEIFEIRDSNASELARCKIGGSWLEYGLAVGIRVIYGLGCGDPWYRGVFAPGSP
jgi:hypothetical protein